MELEMTTHLSLTEKLSDEEATAVIQCFWNMEYIPQPTDHRYETYLDYYEEQRDALSFGLLESSWISKRMVAKTHYDIREIARVLARHRGAALTEIHAHVQEMFPEPVEAREDRTSPAASSDETTKSISNTEGIQLSVELAVRLCLTINVESLDLDVTVGNATKLSWSSKDSSLVDFLNLQFKTYDITVPAKQAQINSDFSAHKLKSICDVEIEWTDCLKYHLHFEGGKLYIYQFQSCLYDHSKLSGSILRQIDSPIYPEAALTEVIRTLKLLFPRDDTTRELLEKAGKSIYTDLPLDEVRNLDLNAYHYWRKELWDLHQLFLRRRQTSFWQALTDKENSLQRWTLWGVLFFNGFTVLFGIISSVVAGYTMQYARDTLDLTREATPVTVTSTITVTARQF